jgi:hypothetical protein
MREPKHTELWIAGGQLPVSQQVSKKLLLVWRGKARSNDGVFRKFGIGQICDAFIAFAVVCLPYGNLRAVSMDMVKFEAWSDQFSRAKN